MKFIHQHVVYLHWSDPMQEYFASLLLLSAASKLLGPEGKTWAVEVGRSTVTFRFANPADLFRLERCFDELGLGKRRECASHPRTCGGSECKEAARGH